MSLAGTSGAKGLHRPRIAGSLPSQRSIGVALSADFLNCGHRISSTQISGIHRMCFPPRHHHHRHHRHHRHYHHHPHHHHHRRRRGAPLTGPILRQPHSQALRPTHASISGRTTCSLASRAVVLPLRPRDTAIALSERRRSTESARGRLVFSRRLSRRR